MPAAPGQHLGRRPVIVNLTVHVVDTVFGVPAADLEVGLRRRTESDWRELARGRTAADGRLAIWQERELRSGTYQLKFDLDGYYATLGSVPLHPRAIVEFRVTDPTADLDLPLLISPNSYCTYRGNPPSES